MAFVCSELFAGCHDMHVFAVPDENRSLAWRNENEATLAVINIDCSGDIEDKITASKAAFNIVLLLFN